MVSEPDGAYSGPIWEPLDLRQYHKTGVLVTSDGSSAVWMCTFVDDVATPSSCFSLALGGPTGYIGRIIELIEFSVNNVVVLSILSQSKY